VCVGGNIPHQAHLFSGNFYSKFLSEQLPEIIMSNNTSITKYVDEGQAAYHREDYTAAAQAYRDAARGYSESGDSLSAAEMLNNSSVAFLQAGDAQAALQAVEGTASVFSLSDDKRRQGMALGNLAAALEAVGSLKEAKEIYQQSAEVLEQAGEYELRSQVMKSLSSLQLRTGHQLEALATMQAGLNNIKHPTYQQRLLKKLLQIPMRLLGR
jgi:tetratricopeptide (TPR) repeat protein